MITENLKEKDIMEQNQNPYNIFQDVKKWLETAGVKQKESLEQHKLGADLIEEELEELLEAYFNKDKQGMTDAIVDLLWVVLNYNHMMNLDAESYAQRVSKSNWSKFCNSIEVAQNTVAAYANGTHPNKPGAKISCYVDEVGEYFIVKRVSDNKIMKSINYCAP